MNATAGQRMDAFSEFLKRSQNYDDRASPDELKFVLSFLQNFGYLTAEGLGSVRDIRRAVVDFQSLYQLKRDGIVGPKTVKAMSRQRCGHPDGKKLGMEHLAVKAWVKARLDKWKKTALTYYVDKYVDELTKALQLKLFQQAWDQWTAVCSIRAKRTISAKTADIIVSVGSGARSDFDGPGGTLAWAYLPTGANHVGQLLMMFDQGETWTNNPKNRQGIYYLPVACHEIGHLIGLDHSRRASALMAPYYNPLITKPQQKDDISRAQKLYGKPSPVGPAARAETGKFRLTVDLTLKDNAIKSIGRSVIQPV